MAYSSRNSVFAGSRGCRRLSLGWARVGTGVVGVAGAVAGAGWGRGWACGRGWCWGSVFFIGKMSGSGAGVVVLLRRLGRGCGGGCSVFGAGRWSGWEDLWLLVPFRCPCRVLGVAFECRVCSFAWGAFWCVFVRKMSGFRLRGWGAGLRMGWWLGCAWGWGRGVFVGKMSVGLALRGVFVAFRGVRVAFECRVCSFFWVSAEASSGAFWSGK